MTLFDDADLATPRPLAPADIEAFATQGHVMVPGLAEPGFVTELRPVVEAAVERFAWDRRPLAERDTYGKAFLQAANLWRRDEAIARFVLADRFAGVAAALLGVEQVRIYHDQALFKEPGGGRTPWHQDQVYWPLDSDRTITMWMALDDIVDPQTGITFADGSHVFGDLQGQSISDASDEMFSDLVAARGFSLTTYRDIRPGDATFHAGWTLHCADGNRSARVRPAMTVIYLADGTRVSESSRPEHDVDRQLWLRDHAPGTVVGGPRHPALPSRQAD